MARRMGRRWSCVITLSLLAPLFAAAETATWDNNFDQGLCAFNEGRYSEALPLLAASLEQARAFPPPDVRYVKSAHTLALLHEVQGRFNQSEPLYLEARKTVEAMGARGRSLLGYVLDGLGELRFDQGRWDEAEPLLRQAIGFCRESHGEQHLCTLTAQRHLAQVLSAKGSVQDAETVFQKLLETLHQKPSTPPEFLAGSLENFASLYIAEARYELAEPLLKESLALETQQGDAQSVVADTLLDLGEMYRLEHDPARAEPLLKRALRIYETANDPHQAGALNELGLVALDQGKYAIAKAHLKRSLTSYQHVFGSAHIIVARVKAGLAEAFLGERNFREAKSLIQEAMTTEKKALGEDHSGFARMLIIAGRIEEQDHCASQAAAYYREAVTVYRRTLRSGHPELVQAEQYYARLAKSLPKESVQAGEDAP